MQLGLVKGLCSGSAHKSPCREVAGPAAHVQCRFILWHVTTHLLKLFLCWLSLAGGGRKPSHGVCPLVPHLATQALWSLTHTCFVKMLM